MRSAGADRANGSKGKTMANEPNHGKVLQVIGPTVDLEFPSDRLPEILNAIKIEDKERDMNLTVEASLHIGDNVVRCVSMASTDGVVRGMKARDTGGPISVPVGEQVLGEDGDQGGEE